MLNTSFYSSLSSSDKELLAVWVASHIIRMLMVLQRSSVAHKDIKLDNMVLRSRENEAPQLCLIDFGLARDLFCDHIDPSAKKQLEYDDMRGAIACIHSVLFYEDLQTVEIPIAASAALRAKGFTAAPTFLSQTAEAILVPKLVTIKRYWNRDIWSCVYLHLLNPQLNVSTLARIHELLEEHLTATSHAASLQESPLDLLCC